MIRKANINNEAVEVKELTLAQYEENGGEYNDEGNGGEDVSEIIFDSAVDVTETAGHDELDVLKTVYPNREFWADSITGLYLCYH